MKTPCRGASPWPPAAARCAIGMARPKLSPLYLRTKRVSVYFSPAELSELRRRTEAAQMSLPAYLRERSLRTAEPSADPRRLAVKEFRVLSRLGNNINQIARALNQGRRAPAFTREDLQQLRELLGYLMPEAED